MPKDGTWTPGEQVVELTRRGEELEADRDAERQRAAAAEARVEAALGREQSYAQLLEHARGYINDGGMLGAIDAFLSAAPPAAPPPDAQEVTCDNCHQYGCDLDDPRKHPPKECPAKKRRVAPAAPPEPLPPDGTLAGAATSVELAIRAILRGERDGWVEHNLRTGADLLRAIARNAVYRAELGRRLGLREDQVLVPAPPQPSDPLAERVIAQAERIEDAVSRGLAPSKVMLEQLASAVAALRAPRKERNE